MLKTLRAIGGIICILGGVKMMITERGFFRGVYAEGRGVLVVGFVFCILGCYLLVQCVRQWRDKGSGESYWKGFWERVKERVKQNQGNN